MVDQGSAAEIMYPDLFKGLGLKSEDSRSYSSPLVSFEGKMIIPKGQIRLPVQTRTDVVEVDFIMARQCLIAAIQHKPKSDISATKENDL